MKHRRVAYMFAIYGLLVAGLLFFQPASPPAAHAQGGTPSLIDVYGAQATANAQATLSAMQQLGSAGQAAQSLAASQAQAAVAQAQVAAAQAQVAAAQAQAVAQAEQATSVAIQQQAQLAALQSTVDAAALQATAVVQQTRTAIEISAQQTKNALDVKATQEARALNNKATQAAIESTRVAAEAQDRDNLAVATSVAMNLQATHTAQTTAATGAQRREDITFAAVVVVVVVMGVCLLYLFVLVARRLARALKQPARVRAAAAPMPGAYSTAALMVIDAATGQASTRVPEVEDDDSLTMHQSLRRLFGNENDDDH